MAKESNPELPNEFQELLKSFETSTQAICSSTMTATIDLCFLMLNEAYLRIDELAAINGLNVPSPMPLFNPTSIGVITGASTAITEMTKQLPLKMTGLMTSVLKKLYKLIMDMTVPEDPDKIEAPTVT